MNDDQARWTEVEHLPEWDEEFYDVYTAKKHGKWVMLKTLKPQFKDDSDMRQMLEKEFDARYNLAHPNIIMINDFEDVPGVGLSIITDDVYGDSLAKLLKEGKVTEKHVEKLRTQLVSALQYIQDNHLVHRPLTPENIIFTENIGNLKLIDVGFEQHTHLSHSETNDDIHRYGLIVKDVLKQTGIHDAQLSKVADKCLDPKRPYANANQLSLALSNRSNHKLYTWIICFLVIMIIVLVWLSICPPKPINPAV